MTLYFHSISQFIHMGGYADYVWSAYSIVLAVMLANLIVAKYGLRKIKKFLAARYNHGEKHASET